MPKLIIIDRKELQKGIEKEKSEHGMNDAKARKTAIDHLKENPHYYSIADSVGLENEETLEETSHIVKPTKAKLTHIPSRTKKLKQYAKKHPGRPFTVVGGSNVAGGSH